MSESETTKFNDTLKTAKHQIITAIIVGVFVGGGTAISFYYNVNNTLANQKQEIKRNEKTIKSLNHALESKADKSDIKSIKKDIRSIQQTQKRIYEVLIKDQD